MESITLAGVASGDLVLYQNGSSANSMTLSMGLILRRATPGELSHNSITGDAVVVSTFSESASFAMSDIPATSGDGNGEPPSGDTIVPLSNIMTVYQAEPGLGDFLAATAPYTDFSG